MFGCVFLLEGRELGLEGGQTLAERLACSAARHPG